MRAAEPTPADAARPVLEQALQAHHRGMAGAAATRFAQEREQAAVAAQALGARAAPANFAHADAAQSPRARANAAGAARNGMAEAEAAQPAQQLKQAAAEATGANSAQADRARADAAQSPRVQGASADAPAGRQAAGDIVGEAELGLLQAPDEPIHNPAGFDAKKVQLQVDHLLPAKLFDLQHSADGERCVLSTPVLCTNVASWRPALGGAPLPFSTLAEVPRESANGALCCTTSFGPAGQLPAMRMPLAAHSMFVAHGGESRRLWSKQVGSLQCMQSMHAHARHAHANPMPEWVVRAPAGGGSFVWSAAAFVHVMPMILCGSLSRQHRSSGWSSALTQATRGRAALPRTWLAAWLRRLWMLAAPLLPHWIAVPQAPSLPPLLKCAHAFSATTGVRSHRAHAIVLTCTLYSASVAMQYFGQIDTVTVWCTRCTYRQPCQTRRAPQCA